jgi:formate-dependent nitrite reductase membrane component NrfD
MLYYLYLASCLIAFVGVIIFSYRTEHKSQNAKDDYFLDVVFAVIVSFFWFFVLIYFFYTISLKVQVTPKDKERSEAT